MISTVHDPKALHARHETADPFPHIVIDGFFMPRFADEIATELERCDIGHWSRDDHAQQVSKRWMDDPERLPRMTRIALRHMNSPVVCEFMSTLTGIDDLQPDPAYLGGGVHATLRGGRLGVHSDLNLHPDSGMHRRVSALLFLNRNWDPSWRGQLELWSKDLEQPAASVDPDFNQLVVFTITDDAFHGMPTPIECPPDRKRFSVALYYYTSQPPEQEKLPSTGLPGSRSTSADHQLSAGFDRYKDTVSTEPSAGRSATAASRVKPASRPRVSVFTPSHQTRYLDDCMRSLLAQTYENWEWIVVLNQGARWRPLVEDHRLRVVVQDDLAGVGAAKRHACSLALGEFLVELDHDDELRSDALELIVEAFDDRPQVGFVFSHFAQIKEDGSRDDSRFDERNGWVYRDAKVDGRLVLQCDSMEAYPHNASLIWFAPNHVRAFRREVYELTGGYDATREVLDDQDIMCRLYQLTEFHLIDECLYLQRMHAKNTQRENEINARIQKETIALYDRYVEPNALAWAHRRGLKALDLGAAHNKPPGYLGVDQYEGPGVDIVGDVSRGIDLPDSSVGVIRAVDFLEHVTDKVGLFNELYRLLAHGGLLLSLTPSTDGRGAFQDPTHVAFYNENSFWYFTDRDYATFVPQIRCRFQTSRLVTYFPSDWHEQHRISYVCANLIAIKDGPRQGGFLLV